MKRSSLRGKMRQLANCQVRHTQAGDKYLSEKKNSLAAIIINLQPTRARPIFLFFSLQYFMVFTWKKVFFSFLINFNFFSLRLNWVLGRRAGWWLDERNHPAYVMTNQLTKCALRLRIHPFFEKCKIHFFIFAEYNFSSADHGGPSSPKNQSSVLDWPF